MECRVWNLERYARLSNQTTTATTTNTDGWEYFDNKSEKLELTVTSSDHMFIHLGKKQMESFALVGISTVVKGVSKGDSLMVVGKLQTKNRRFRVKFSANGDTSGGDCCRECVHVLSRHFPIKLPVDDHVTSSQQKSSLPNSSPFENNGPVLVDDVTIGQIVQVVADKDGPRLPELYYHGNDLSNLDLNTAIKLCLTDPHFPAFVGLVEKQLEIIKKE